MTCSPLQIALGRLSELHPSGSLASPKSICRKGTRYMHFNEKLWGDMVLAVPTSSWLGII